MSGDQHGFFLQNDPRLNEREAWPAQEFPQATYHYFRDSGCVMTSLWNMCLYYEAPGFAERFPTPWELNEACKASGAFYPNANVEMAFLERAMPASYRDRFAYDAAALRDQLETGTMCLVRANGKNSAYHYVLPLEVRDGEVRCFDPKLGYTVLSDYEKIFQIIRFRRLW